MAQTTCFRTRMVLLGVRTMGNHIWGNMPQNPQKWARIGNFKPKRQNMKIAISPKLLIGSRPNLRIKPRSNPIWLPAAIYKNGYDVITRPPIDQLLRNLAGRCDIPTTKHTSKSKPEIGIQHGGRPFSDTGTSFISAVDWDFSPKFGTQIDFHLLKWVQSPHLNPEVDFRLYGSHLKNRQDVITSPLFVWLLWHLAGRCKMTCRWLHMGPYWNRK